MRRKFSKKRPPNNIKEMPPPLAQSAPAPNREAFTNCINNALDRLGYTAFALAKSLEDVRSAAERAKVRELLKRAGALHDEIKGLLHEC
jgi:hypothetical protein